MRSLNAIFPPLLATTMLFCGQLGHTQSSPNKLNGGEVAVSGVPAPEDLVALSGSPWVIVSSMSTSKGSPGHLYAVDSEGPRTPFNLFTTTPPASALKESGTCPSLLSPIVFGPHGIAIRKLDKAVSELLVVNHGGRESVEIFRISIVAGRPRAEWAGCVPLPPHSYGNGVAPLSDGGFVVSDMYDPLDKNFVQKFAVGAPTGYVLKWTPAGGWAHAVERSFSGANGVEVSADGSWLFVCEWAAHKLWRFPLGGAGEVISTRLAFLPDNIHWTDAGTLLLAGQNTLPQTLFHCEAARTACPSGFTVTEINPADLTQHRLVSAGDQEFGGATGAIYIGRKLWVGTVHGDKIRGYSRPSLAP